VSRFEPWAIGSDDERSADLIDTYREPKVLGDLVWRVGADNEQ
jgi:hypothetical protein